jgi:eukaryotic-like serine/threonine-protein kinase
MGEVWVATDTVLGRRVAVKLLRPELASDPRLVARFRREAVAAARLSHPSIVSVYDTVSDDGVEAVVMQLVRGKSLRQVLDREGRLSPATVRRIGISLADGLDAAHRAGVVHRDVKPGNVLLTPDGRILLADFGLAKVLDTDDGLSMPRGMVGTAKYLAPEQVEGRPVDGRADLYSLGVVLYECLTGRVPFRESTDADTARARLERDAPPLRMVRPGVPKGLADVVDHLLARAADQRPASAAIVRDELRRLVVVGDDELHLDPDPSPAPEPRDADATPPVPYEGPQHRRDHGGWYAATAAILVLAGALATAGFVFARTDAGDRFLQTVTGRTATTATTGAPTTAAAVVASPTTAEAEVGQIVSAGEFDPPPTGDGKENPKRIGYLTDGDPSTSWTTVCYGSATMAPKVGVGLIFELSEVAAGHHLAVDSLTDGWSGAVFVADRPASTLDGWGPPVQRQTNLAEGTTSFDLGGGNGRYVMLFIERAAKSPGCKGRFPYQARIAEISLTR